MAIASSRETLGAGPGPPRSFVATPAIVDFLFAHSMWRRETALEGHGLAPPAPLGYEIIRGILVVELAVLIALTLLFDAVLLGWLAWAFHAPRFQAKRMSPSVSLRATRGERLRTMGVISALSLATIVSVLVFLHRYLVTTTPTSAGTIVLQAAGVLVLYDFIYYGLHRTMHVQSLMRFVHGVHHRAKNPSALESFFMHPVELLAGLALLVFSTWIVGPVHVYAFAFAFFIYSTLNIVIHSGLQFGHPLLWPIDALTAKHFVHHMTDHGKNFSSLTPLPDLVFRTAGSIVK